MERRQYEHEPERVHRGDDERDDREGKQRREVAAELLAVVGGARRGQARPPDGPAEACEQREAEEREERPVGRLRGVWVDGSGGAVREDSDEAEEREQGSDP